MDWVRFCFDWALGVMLDFAGGCSVTFGTRPNEGAWNGKQPGGPEVRGQEQL